MVDKNYLKASIISVIIILIISIVFIGQSGQPGFTSILPIDSLGLQFLYFFTWMWLGAIIGIFFGYILAPLFLYIHKQIIGRSMTYGIQEIQDPNPNKFKGILKGFFPALMAINFALIFFEDPFIHSLIIGDMNPSDAVTIILGMVILLSVTSGIAIALFSPVWFLQDSGIIYSNKEKLEKKRLPLEVRSVGGWYLYLLKGYAGISVLLSFYIIFSNYATQELENIPGLIFFLVFPITLTLLMIPSIIILEKITEHRTKYMQKYAKKFGIVKKVQVKFEEI